MVRGGAKIVMVLAVGACNLDTGGLGTGDPPAVGDDTGGDSGSVEDGAETGGGSGVGDTGGMDGSATTMPPPDDSADSGPSMDSGGSGGAMVVISDGSTFDFGLVEIDTSGGHSFKISNEGDADASAFEVGGLAGSFVITETDCEAVLAAGDDCSVSVRFSPSVFGYYDGELVVGFTDGGVPGSVSRPVTGAGIGTTDNMIVNGNGETGSVFDIPPMGWEAALGPNWAITDQDVPPIDGAHTIHAGWGPPGGNDFILFQSMSVAGLTNWGDASGVRFYYRAFHRPLETGNDPTSVALRFGNAAGGELQLEGSAFNATASWQESVGNWEAPPDTHNVQMVLICHRDVGDWCSGYYDAIEVWAEWLG